jgi:hypothetical protein
MRETLPEALAVNMLPGNQTVLMQTAQTVNPIPKSVLRRRISVLLLNCGAGMMILGGLGDLLIRTPPDAWSPLVGQPVAALSPGIARLLIALLHALGSALIASGIAVLFVVNGPFRRGAKWAGITIAVLAILSDGMNAFQIFRLGASYFWVPLTFAVLVLSGLVVAFVPSPAFPERLNG